MKNQVAVFLICSLMSSSFISSGSLSSVDQFCEWTAQRGDVRGIVERRKVKSYQALLVDGVRITLLPMVTQRDKGMIFIKGDSGIIKNLVTKVDKNKTLHIGFSKQPLGVGPLPEIVCFVDSSLKDITTLDAAHVVMDLEGWVEWLQCPHLTVSSYDSSKVILHHIEAENLLIAASGHSEVYLAGRADFFSAYVEQWAKVETTQLVTNESDIHLYDAGQLIE